MVEKNNITSSSHENLMLWLLSFCDSQDRPYSIKWKDCEAYPKNFVTKPHTCTPSILYRYEFLHLLSSPPSFSGFQNFILSGFPNFSLSGFRNFSFSDFYYFSTISFLNFSFSSIWNFSFSDFNTKIRTFELIVY